MNYRECHTAEADIGMSFYLTEEDGSGGRLKSRSEDFIVCEISKHPDAKENGKFTIAEITSNNWETNRLVRILSRSLGISRERIGFAGTKDKRAITTQLMSFECPPEKFSTVELKDVTISDMYTAGRGIQIGDLIGNSFEITVTGSEPNADNIASMIARINETGGFPNYFGVQRFGTARPITHLVGEKIIRGDMKGAVDIYLTAPSKFEMPEVTEARRLLSEDPEEAIKMMPKTMSYERIMAEHLIKRPDDHIGALSSLPSNLQMMFVHAYQSFLFNQMISERMRSGIPLNSPVEGDVVIPLDNDGIPMHERPVIATSKNLDLVSKQVRKGKAFITATLFGSESAFTDGTMGEIERKVVGSHNVKNNDFVVPRLSYCNSKGSRREILCPVKDLSYSLNDDTYTMSFSLSKGNYATCLMREFMKSDMECY